MRPTYIVGVVIGLTLIYLGLFGTAGLGLSLTGSLYTEEFDDLNGWKIYTSRGAIVPVIAPGTAQLLLHGGAWVGDGYDTRSAIDDDVGALSGPNIIESATSLPYTLELKVSVESWGSGAHGKFDFAAMFGSYYWFFMATQNKMLTGQWANDGDFSQWTTVASTTTDTNWHVYTVVCTSKTDVKLYQDTTLLGSLHCYQAAKSPRFQVEASDDATVRVEYIKADAGEHPPTGGPPTQTSLTIHTQFTSDGTTWQNALNVQVAVVKDGQLLGSWTTDANGLYVSSSALPGSYSFSATYQGKVAYGDTSIILATGEAKTVNLYFNLHGTDEPKPNGTIPDIWGMIKTFINTPNVKQLMLVAGIGITGICGIMFVLPEKRYPPPPPPRPYY